ncbi:MAG: hypothetical protein KAR20_13810 [Candidatus Heimdallarchaeota archaeon]|nr:hypothetical protein [Candidatus Heimdallarchaeota archaeon]
MKWIKGSTSKSNTVEAILYDFETVYHVGETVNITIPLAYYISNFSLSEPDALGIIAPSGSNKTELLRIFGEKEDERIYPVSSITAHTFVSGYKENQDLVPLLKGRLIVIKDLTTILSKNKNIVSEIFADFRDVLDGYVKKVFGNGEIKEYSGIHSCILFACTNAIERHYSLYSVLGQRIIFFRPQNDRTTSRRQATKNAGHEIEIRIKLHKNATDFLEFVLTTQDKRIKSLSQNVPEDMKERIGMRCEFLAVVRTYIPRNERGDMAALPEPEYATRLSKTICKIVDAHSLLYDRLPNEEDERIAIRLIHDNIPTERLLLLKVLATSKQPMSTTDVGLEARTPSSMTRRVLDDLTALGIIEKTANTQGTRTTYMWHFPAGDHKQAFFTVLNHRRV